MGDNTGIEWTDATWNPTAGCTIVSPGCTNCYAMKEAHGLERRFGSPKYSGLTRVVNGHPIWTGEVRLVESALDQPRRWKRPRRIFVNSMSDLFHESLTDAEIDRVFAGIMRAPQHTYQILTKRADRMRDYSQRRLRQGGPRYWPLPTVWLGVSVEDQRRAAERIPALLETPAAVRFLSCEPLLGPVDLNAAAQPAFALAAHNKPAPWIDWVIVGGESGPGSRPMDLRWAQSLADQCSAADVSCFVKQLGAKPTLDGAPYRLPPRDPKGGDWTDWPAGLKVRAFPDALALGAVP